MKSLRARTSIHACPADIYHVLTDYENYQQWNPWLRVIRGEAVEGKYLIVRPHLWLMIFPLKYQYEKVEQSAILRRTQVGWTHYLAHTKRERVIYTKTDGSALYTTSLSFEGPLGPIIQFLYGRLVYKGIKNETQALKKFCEEHHNLDAANKQDKRQVPHRKYPESKPGRIDIPDFELARVL